ncbi:chromate efflux transporter [Alteromonas facilis]|uniref:chromate efflux transporter n=1 Tax=Alteromonas facilis TaxID=2048004 RepID=UPI001F0BCDE8|nr:chromate efflux transporter [Alteromonas facilis]
MLDIFWVFFRLGCTSFGGPVAHLGYFRDAFVNRRHWLTDEQYSNLVALCQFIPGPASSQVGAAIGYNRAGYAGAVAAWIGFTLPSAVILTAFALSIVNLDNAMTLHALHGLKLVAVAVVTQAVWGMQKQLCTTFLRKTFAIAIAVLLVLFPSIEGQMGAIIVAGVTTFAFAKRSETEQQSEIRWRIPISSIICGVLCVIGLFVFVGLTDHSPLIALFDKLYRSGALVFGGGHVVLPLMHSEFVQTGLIQQEQFLMGYGAAQAVPGPLFTIAAYIGASAEPTVPLLGATVSIVAIFLPGMLLLFAVMPIWAQLQHHWGVKQALIGINTAVVGILLAVLIDPLISQTMLNISDIIVVILATAGLIYWRLHPLWILAASVCISVLIQL